MSNADSGIESKPQPSRTKRIVRWVALAFCVLVAGYFFVASRGCYQETACPSTDPKIMALYEVNNRLNKAFARHDWEFIYNQLLQGYKIRTRGKENTSYTSYHDFESRLYQAGSFMLFYSLRMISYDLDGDRAKTSNFMTAKVAFWPVVGVSDTSFHNWHYVDGQWWLYDFDGRNTPDHEGSPEIKELLYDSSGSEPDGL